ncbi:MAG: alkaline phosphatase family protein [Xanthomonadales bacterium]|nr:alkaline phosphatase family protein [Xanthomonadales bacterium]
MVIIQGYTLPDLFTMLDHFLRLFCKLRTIILISLLLILTACEQQQKLPPRELDHPLILIGLDGAEWGVIKPMIANGELPNLKKLMDAGVHGGLINPGAMISPPVWTTFITGEHPRIHGVLDHVFPFDDTSSKQPVNSTLRVKPALWNIASEAGLRTAALGYFVSWPAEDIHGTVVTDRAMQKYTDSVFPPSSVRSVNKIVEELIDDDAHEEFLRRYYAWGYRPEQANNPDDEHYKAARLIIGRADRLFVNDEIIRRTAIDLQTDAYDFVSVYLRSTDLASHSFWREFDDSGFDKPADPELKHQLGDVIPETYRFVDETIGDLIDKFGSEANFIIISDHGFESAKKEIILSSQHQSVLTGNHLPVGVFIASGPDIQGQSDMPADWQVTVVDIFPTLARLLQLPIAKSLPGAPLDSIFMPEFLAAQPVLEVAGYPVDGFARKYNSAVAVNQTKEMDSLSGLGYIGGSTTEGSSEQKIYNFWMAKDRLLIEHTSGEIVSALLNDKYQHAEKTLLRFLKHKPELEKVLLRAVRKRLHLLAESEYMNRALDGQKVFQKFRRKFNRTHPGVWAEGAEKA